SFLSLLSSLPSSACSLCFSHHAATPEISTLSLHDALPIYAYPRLAEQLYRLGVQQVKVLSLPHVAQGDKTGLDDYLLVRTPDDRSEEHTSELQSRENLVCRLLLEKKKKTTR